MAAFFAILFVTSLFALARLDMDGASLETHRFVTAAFFTGPLVGLAVFARRFSAAPSRARVAWYAAAIVGASLFLTTFSTVGWVFASMSTSVFRNDGFYATFNHYVVDCRREVGATVGARARYTYISKSLWFLFSGCSPIFAPGIQTGGWKAMTVGTPRFGKDQLGELRKQMPKGEAVPVICPLEKEPGDPVCAAVEANRSCHVVGWNAKECVLSAAEAANVR